MLEELRTTYKIKNKITKSYSQGGVPSKWSENTPKEWKKKSDVVKHIKINIEHYTSRIRYVEAKLEKADLAFQGQKEFLEQDLFYLKKNLNDIYENWLIIEEEHRVSIKGIQTVHEML
jgi:hypothetical protein